MGETPDTAAATMFSRSVGIGKDLVSLLRDGARFVLALLLVVFPAQFNSIYGWTRPRRNGIGRFSSFLW